MFGIGSAKTTMVTAQQALPGRDAPLPVPSEHEVLGTPLVGPWPSTHIVLYLGMGCFWGAERLLWQVDGVYSTAVGYMGGWTKNPTYEETCTAKTGHTEAVMVVYNPVEVRTEDLLKVFWENHDPTTLYQQGNDVGTQYRSAIFTTDDKQLNTAHASADSYQRSLDSTGHGRITTQIDLAENAGDGRFYYAEDYHQQYLHKNPRGYCNHGFCQVAYVPTD